MLDSLVTNTGAWLLTYAIHSTILIAAVWLLVRLRPKMSPSFQNAMWKVALVGALATATFQVTSGIAPISGTLDLPAVSAMEAPEAAAPSPLAPTGSADGYAYVDPSMLATVETLEPIADDEPAPANPFPWAWLVVGLWLAGASFALTRLGFSVRALNRRLASRREVIEDPALESFLQLLDRAGIRRRVRLTASSELITPVALWRSEVCIPERALEQLEPAALVGVLGHEIAHLERRDPHWLCVAALVESLFFFQPFNRVARRGMQHSAELLCDDWAVRLTGDGTLLAKALAIIAGWTERSAQPPSPMLAQVVGPGRPLLGRVERLLDRDASRSPRDRAPWRIGAAVAALAAVALLAPGARAADAEEPSERVAVDEFVWSEYDGGRSASVMIVERNGTTTRIEADADGRVVIVEESDGGNHRTALRASKRASRKAERARRQRAKERRRWSKRRARRHDPNDDSIQVWIDGDRITVDGDGKNGGIVVVPPPEALEALEALEHLGKLEALEHLEVPELREEQIEDIERQVERAMSEMRRELDRERGRKPAKPAKRKRPKQPAKPAKPAKASELPPPTPQWI